MKKETTNRSKFLGQKVKITKVIDDAFEGNHPNGIKEGYEAIGTLHEFFIGNSVCLSKEDGRTFYTSAIREINEETGIFETENSTYLVEIQGEPIKFEEEYEKKAAYADIAVEEAPAMELEVADDEMIELVMDEGDADVDARAPQAENAVYQREYGEVRIANVRIADARDGQAGENMEGAG